MKKILLDTSGFSKFLNGDEKVLEIIVKSDVVFMSVFVLGELYAAFKAGSKYKQNVQILNQFLKKSTVQILQGSLETAEIFGEIKNNLKKAGTPIPMNDVWIAAHATEFGAQVVTYDSHFKTIPGLRLWDNI